MSGGALLPAAGDQAPLKNTAPAAEQMARMLDALLILDAEGACRVADLAQRVGLQEGRLRDLLSSYMVAAADAVGTAAPFTISFGTAEGPLGSGPEDDARQAAADVVHLSRLRSGAVLEDLGRQAVGVDEVARGLLSARALLAAGVLDERHRGAVAAVAGKLEAALAATVTAPVDAAADRLRQAVRERRVVRFRYRDPWTGEQSEPRVEPYAVRRRRDRLYLDAGPEPGVGFRPYDVSAVTDVEVEEAATFVPPVLPPEEQRDDPVTVVLRVPKDSAAERRLCEGWDGRVVGPVGGKLDVAVRLDRAHAVGRLGVLLLQLGAPCAVVSPPELCEVAVPVARRLLAGLPQAGA